MRRHPNEITIVRHGEKESNRSKRDCELTLSDEGYRQVSWAAEIISRSTSASYVFTSPSKRAQETAQVISPYSQYVSDDRILECGWGTGYPGGGESREEAKQRLSEFLDDVSENCAGQNVLIVTHGSLMKIAEEIIENRSSVDNRIVDNCEIIKYSTKDDETQNHSSYLRWKSVISPFNNHPMKSVIPFGLDVTFLRHGESESNRDSILAGGMDFPLTVKGLEQAKDASSSLLMQGIKFDKIFSSPLSRALVTAQIIADSCGINENDITVLDDITGCGGGDLEGRPYSEWYSTPPEELVSKHGVESYTNQRKRIGRAVIDIIKSSDRHERILVVSHSSVFQVMQAVNIGAEDSEDEVFSKNRLAAGEYKNIIF